MKRLTRKDLAKRAAEAESVLRKIRAARVNFAIDPGGPPTALEGILVIEHWIDTYFKGEFFGDVEVIPPDPLLQEALAD